ncbi:MAG: cytosine deaminase [Pseudomonadota bacterium]
MRDSLTIPAGGAYRLVNANVPECLLPEDTVRGAPIGPAEDELAGVDMTIDALGRVAEIQAAGTLERRVPKIDLEGAMVIPSPVDVHTHLDKGHIWPRAANPDGSFMGALKTVAEDREANWSSDDVRARMAFSLKSAYAQGTRAIRTHLDSVPPQHSISWPVFAELKEEWADKIELQAAPLFSIETATPEYLGEIAQLIKPHGGPLGCVAYMIDGVDAALDRVFKTAADNGLDLDFHVDETEDPKAEALYRIALAAERNAFEGKILCGHCCSLALHEEGRAKKTLDLMAKRNMAVVSLPLCNMYLQDRHAGRTPRWRGVSLLHEMAERDIPVMVASDNTRDPFYAYGDLDLWEVFRSGVRTIHLDHPFGDWIKTITDTPAKIMGLDAGYFAPGILFDAIIFRGRSYSETLSRAETGRAVIRNGRAIDTTLPDFDELDSRVGG